MTLDLDGSYVYIPAAGYRGPDSFTYIARDATAASRVATVAITVTPTGGPPPAAVTDLPAVLRAGNGFLLRDSLTTGAPTTSFSYGAQPQTVIMGDWNGDGVATPGTFSGGVFKLRNSNTAGPPEVTFTFGDPRGYPVAGDFNGDGTNTVGVYRNGVWQLTNVNAASTPMVVNFGAGSWPSTVPLVGDYDGDGTDTLGTWTAGTFSLRNTNTTGPAEVSVAYGPANAYPLVGDWNGDGTDTVGVRTTTAAWQLNNANDTSPADLTFTYGLPNDLPLVWRKSHEGGGALDALSVELNRDRPTPLRCRPRRCGCRAGAAGVWRGRHRMRDRTARRRGPVSSSRPRGAAGQNGDRAAARRWRDLCWRRYSRHDPENGEVDHGPGTSRRRPPDHGWSRVHQGDADPGCHGRRFAGRGRDVERDHG